MRIRATTKNQGARWGRIPTLTAREGSPDKFDVGQHLEATDREGFTFELLDAPPGFSLTEDGQHIIYDGTVQRDGHIAVQFVGLSLWRVLRAWWRYCR